MRRLTIGLALFAAFWAAPSYAQQKPVSALSDDEKVAKSVADEIDRQYRATLNKTAKEGTEVRVDPWSNMRSPQPASNKR